MDRNHDLGTLQCAALRLEEQKSTCPGYQTISSSQLGLPDKLGGRWRWWEGAAATPQDLGEGGCLVQISTPLRAYFQFLGTFPTGLA